MSSRLSVTLIRSRDELEEIVPAWTALWAACANATPFQSPGWLLSWWRAFHPGELVVAATWLGQKLVGLAPFYLHRDEAGARLLPIGISVSDYLDVLADPALAGPVLAATSRVYASFGDPWRAWELAELREGATARAIPSPAGCACQDRVASVCPVLVLPEHCDDPDDLPFIPAPMRRKYRMSRNRLERAGGAVFLSTSDREPGWWADELARLHRLRWSARGEPGVLANDPRLLRFHREVFATLAACGALSLHALQVNGVCVGIYYGLRDATRAYAYLGGFDPAAAYYSPGTALIGAAIANAFGSGAREFHFLRGQEAYKYRWGAQDRANISRTFVRTSS